MRGRPGRTQGHEYLLTVSILGCTPYSLARQIIRPLLPLKAKSYNQESVSISSKESAYNLNGHSSSGTPSYLPTSYHDQYTYIDDTDTLKSATCLCVHLWCSALLFLNVFLINIHNAENILLLCIDFISWTNKVKNATFDVIYMQTERGLHTL